MKASFLPLSLLVVLTLIGCGGPPESPSADAGPNVAEEEDAPVEMAAVHNLDAKEAAALLETNEAVVVLDVRTPAEFAEGHIPDAENVDFNADDFQARLEELDKSKPYLVHCASGGRSSKTRDMMKDLNFSQIYHLDGGFNAWAAADQPVEK